MYSASYGSVELESRSCCFTLLLSLTLLPTFSYFAAATMPSLATVKAPTNEPSCRRSLVPKANLCSTSASASTRNILSFVGMSILKTHLQEQRHT